MRRALRLAALGALAGTLGWGAIVGLRAIGVPLLAAVGWVQLGPLSLAPGLAFGVVIGPALLARASQAWHRRASYVAASGLSYLVAYHAAFVLLGVAGADGVVGPALAGIGAGACGSALLGALTIALTAAPPRRLRAALIAGSAAGALFPLVPLGDWTGPPPGLLAFLASWQAIYAAALAPLLADADPSARLS